MTQLWLDESCETEAVSIASVIPCGFVTVSEGLQQRIDRKLGYFGQARFAFFYYEPRGSEVVWNDGRTYGFGSGGWITYMDEILPLGRRYGADLGSDEGAGSHVLVLDRMLCQAYFAERECAETLVTEQYDCAA